MPQQKKSKASSINTGGGAYVGGTVNTSGGKFVGRDDHSVNITTNPDIAKLFQTLTAAIEQRPHTDTATKSDLQSEAAEIQAHAQAKGDSPDENFLERRARNILRMAPDILDVIIASVGSPAAGFMLALKKSAEKAKQSAGK